MQKNWQLRMSLRSLKKMEKLKKILSFLESTSNKRCLEVGCNKGVISFFLRARGGHWTNADMDEQNVKDTKELVGEDVCLINTERLIFEDSSFDCIIAIDFLEHIYCDEDFLREFNRILKPKGSLYITSPHSNEKLLVVHKIRKYIGMNNSCYGHVRSGYSLVELQEKLFRTGFEVTCFDTFSRFFTEIIELFLNFGYLFILNKNKVISTNTNRISPVSQQDFEKHRLLFLIYSLAYPLLWSLSQLDKLIWFTDGYVLILRAKKI